MDTKLRRRIVEALLTEKDNRKKILKVFKDRGVTEEVAEWAHGLNNKNSIWVVNTALDK